MTDRHDQAALCALSDALADAASVHASAREVADNPAVAQELAAEAKRLREFSAQVRDCPVDSKPGSALQLVDQLKLLADRLLDDNDAAARAASRESIAALLNLVDDLQLVARRTKVERMRGSRRCQVRRVLLRRCLAGGAFVRPGESSLVPSAHPEHGAARFCASYGSA